MLDGCPSALLKVQVFMPFLTRRRNGKEQTRGALTGIYVKVSFINIFVSECDDDAT
jgi:hypothetical protein